MEITQLFIYNKSHHLPGNFDLPEARSGHSMVSVDNFVYIIGGYNPDTPTGENGYKEIWRFHVPTQVWTKIEINSGNLPDEMLSNAAAYHPALNSIIFTGGTGIPFGETINSGLYRIKVSAKSANVSLILDDCSNNYGQSLTLWGNNILIYGGTTGQIYSDSLEEFIFDGSKLVRDGGIITTFQECYKHTATLFKGTFLIFGGGNAQGLCNTFKELLAYSMNTCSWYFWHTKPDSDSKTYPDDRKFHAGVMVTDHPGLKDSYIICGGMNEIGQSLDDIWSLDLRKRRWTKWKKTLPHPTYFHTAAFVPLGKLIIFGGVHTSSSGVKRTNQLISCWMTVPSLSILAWEACLSCNPRIATFARSKLYRLKISTTFYEQHIQTDDDF